MKTDELKHQQAENKQSLVLIKYDRKEYEAHMRKVEAKIQAWKKNTICPACKNSVKDCDCSFSYASTLTKV